MAYWSYAVTKTLFYRLSVVQIRIPPLRERREDIQVLARHFVEKYSKQITRRVTKISPEAELLLNNYNWPGNVRELRNTIERAMILGSGDVITAGQLPEQVVANGHRNTQPAPLYQVPGNGLTLADLEKQMVEQALEITSGNQVRAARLLGIRRDAFRNRMKKYGLL